MNLQVLSKAENLSRQTTVIKDFALLTHFANDS